MHLNLLLSKPLEFEGLKWGLYNISHNPRYSIVILLRSQLAITVLASVVLYLAMSVKEI